MALSVPKGVFHPQDAIRTRIQNAGKDRTLVVGAYCRGRLLDSQRVTVKAGQVADVELRPESDVGGVYRVTVFEEIAGEGQARFQPLAERLVYRAGHPARSERQDRQALLRPRRQGEADTARPTTRRMNRPQRS